MRVRQSADVQREGSLLVLLRRARRGCACAAQNGKLFGKIAKQSVVLVCLGDVNHTFLYVHTHTHQHTIATNISIHTFQGLKYMCLLYRTMSYTV